MFKIGQRRTFSFGSFTVDAKFDVDFQYYEKRPGRINVYRIVTVYRLSGRSEQYIGISDKGHILKLKLSSSVIAEKIK